MRPGRFIMTSLHSVYEAHLPFNIVKTSQSFSSPLLSSLIVWLMEMLVNIYTMATVKSTESTSAIYSLNQSVDCQHNNNGSAVHVQIETFSGAAADGNSLVMN